MSAIVSIKCDCCKVRFFTNHALIVRARAAAHRAGWKSIPSGIATADFCPVCAKQIPGLEPAEDTEGIAAADAAASSKERSIA